MAAQLDDLFQFTPLREGRLPCRAPFCPTRYFNSRPSARGDAGFGVMSVIVCIKFHAPPGGAPCRAKVVVNPKKFQFTPLREGRRPRRAAATSGDDISIHAPPRGATRLAGRRTGACAYFNSRPSARGDKRPRKGKEEKNISIHAPPRGATGDFCRALDAARISIHAPPRGATLTISLLFCAFTFQFTPLREGRRQKICNFCKSFVQPLQISMA